VRERIVQYSVYVGVRLFICVLQSMRLETCERLAGGMAVLFADLFAVRGDVVEDNLRHALPQLDSEDRRQLARRMWKHLFLMVAEVAHAPRKIHETNWRRYIRLVEPRLLTSLLLSERPTIVVSAHFGNFELAGYVLGLLGFPTYTVARTLDNPYLDAFLNRFRSATGQFIVAKKGGYEQILAVLGGGGTMTFLADQYAGSKGCWVNFFDRPASAHKAIALFSLDHDAPMAIGFARRLGKPLHYEIGTTAALDPRSQDEAASGISPATQWYTSQLESLVRRSPDQYWWLHRRWKDHRAQRRAARSAA